jgi:hypothetical protein
MQSVSLLNNSVWQMQSVSLLNNCAWQMQSVSLLNNCVWQMKSVSLLNNCVWQMKSVSLLNNSVWQMKSVSLLNNSVWQMQSVSLLNNSVWQMQSVSLLNINTPLFFLNAYYVGIHRPSDPNWKESLNFLPRRAYLVIQKMWQSDVALCGSSSYFIWLIVSTAAAAGWGRAFSSFNTTLLDSNLPC